MKLKIPAKLVELCRKALEKAGRKEAAASLKERVARYGQGDDLEIDIELLGDTGLEAMYQVAKEQKERGLMMEISSYRNILAAPATAKVGTLKSLPVGLVAYLRQNAIDGWLYERTPENLFVPWLVRSIIYKAPTRESGAAVKITLVVNAASTDGERGRNANEPYSKSFQIMADDIVKKSIPEILAADNLFHETEELKASYEKDVAAFRKFRGAHGKQFSGDGLAIVTRNYREEAIKLGLGTRMVNDEALVKRTLLDRADSSFWEEFDLADKFDQLPFRCYLWMFHLGLHENLWVHVSFLKPYEYRPELRDKLILPELHRDLVDILTTDMDVMLEDIIEGKSGGTTILCKGGPGLGKTLTAEVYSEVIKKPLYRVHSGQLGIEAPEVEKNLETILKRAARWSAVLLIDEADVFVRKRENDIHHNAVVASFLRTLEYFDGLLFMTTNRSDDIDDAILSRCIAVIKYEAPDTEAATRIWQVLSTQFEINLDAALIDELVAKFPTASGRDIKELLKLSSKFARRKEIPLNYEVFRQCAMFRGLA